MKSGVMELELG